MAGKQAPRPSQLSIPEPQDNPSEFVINQVCSEGHGRRPMKENQALDSLSMISFHLPATTIPLT